MESQKEITYQDFRNLRSDKNFIWKIIMCSFLFPIPLVNAFFFLFLYMFLCDSIENRRAKLPAITVMHWKNLQEHWIPVSIFTACFTLLAVSIIYCNFTLLAYFITFLSVPSIIFTIFLYAHEGNARNFLNFHKLALFWRQNGEGLIIPSGIMLLSLIITFQSAFFCLSFLAVFGVLFLINYTINTFDKDLYGN